jgi:hypothetical protein
MLKQVQHDVIKNFPLSANALLLRNKRDYGFCFHKLRLLQTKDLRPLLSRLLLKSKISTSPSSSKIFQRIANRNTFQILPSPSARSRLLTGKEKEMEPKKEKAVYPAGRSETTFLKVPVQQELSFVFL